MILSWNGKHMLEEYVPSVLASTYRDLEVIVADNHSTDGTIDMLADRFPAVRVIALEKNFGFAAGYNEALRQVNAEYVVLLNQDVEVTPGWLEPLVAVMDSDPRIAACQPKVKDLRDRNMFEYAGAAGGFMDALAYPFCRGRLFETVEEDTGQYNDTIDCAWASGAAMMVRADLYHRFAGLDADFTAHMEEIDLCWRWRNSGYRILCCPQSTVYHLGGASLARGNARKTFLNFRNNFIMLIKNERGGRLIYKIPVRFALDVVAALRFLFTGKGRHWWAVIRAHAQVIFWFGRWWRKHLRLRRLIAEHRVGPGNISGTIKGWLVWKYFIQGKKKFNQLW